MDDKILHFSNYSIRWNELISKLDENDIKKLCINHELFKESVLET